MGNPFERGIFRRFVDAVEAGDVAFEGERGEVLARLYHIEHGLHALHGKLDHIYARIETMDTHVKGLSDAVNLLVTAVNTTTSTITQSLANLSTAIDNEDADEIDRNKTAIMNAVGSLNTANAAIAAAHKPVAATLGVQATPASTVAGTDTSNTQTAQDQAAQSGLTDQSGAKVAGAAEAPGADSSTLQK